MRTSDIDRITEQGWKDFVLGVLHGCPGNTAAGKKKWLADVARVSTATVGNWVRIGRGCEMPKVETLQNIAEKLGLRLDQLIVIILSSGEIPEGWWQRDEISQSLQRLADLSDEEITKIKKSGVGIQANSYPAIVANLSKLICGAA